MTARWRAVYVSDTSEHALSIMTLAIAICLFFAGAIGGALNSVAGGGSFVAFPALLFTGVPPIPANASNTVALWAGAVASGGAYRDRLNMPARVLAPLLAASLTGGLAGAFLLLRTPAQTFLHVLPWLTLGATLLFAFGRKLAGARTFTPHQMTTRELTGATLFQFAVGVYGGYFGGGMGIVMLAMLAMLGMSDIHGMNALKTVMGSVINGVAALAFIFSRAVYWKQAIVMIAGAIVGGYLGAHYAQRLSQNVVRAFVVGIGAAMTIYFFWKAY